MTSVVSAHGSSPLYDFFVVKTFLLDEVGSSTGWEKELIQRASVPWGKIATRLLLLLSEPKIKKVLIHSVAN